MKRDAAIKEECRARPFGFLAYLVAGASIVACFATAVVTYLTAAFGLSAIIVNPHLQPVIM